MHIFKKYLHYCFIRPYFEEINFYEKKRATTENNR